MANVTPPYADPGRASFEELDTYTQNFLLAGLDPPLRPAYSYPLPQNSSFEQFSVVGLDADGKLALATFGVVALAATGALTFSDVGPADATITIGSVTYTMKASPSAANEVKVGANVTESAANLVAAINGTGNASGEYGAGTASHPSVKASSAAGVVTITAKEAGAAGNAIATTETSANIAFGGATLTGGVDAQGVTPIGVLAHASSLGASGSGTGPVWYSGCFNQDALVWHPSFNTDAKKEAAFRGAPTPTTIIVAKR